MNAFKYCNTILSLLYVECIACVLYNNILLGKDMNGNIMHHEVYSVSWSCLLSFLCNPYIPFQIYEIFYLLVLVALKYR